MADFVGTAGDDALLGTAAADNFDLTAGGTDSARGFGDNDFFNFGNTFTVGDVVDGGDGDDVLRLEKYVGTGVVFDPTNFISVETVRLVPEPPLGMSAFHLVFAGNLNLNMLTIDGGALDGGLFQVDFSQASGVGLVSLDPGAVTEVQVTSGTTKFFVGATDRTKVTFLGGTKADVMVWEQSAGAQRQPLLGSGSPFNLKSTFDGAGGNDTLQLHGDLSAGLVFRAATITNVETIRLLHDYSYDLTLVDGNVAAGATLTLEAGGVSGAGSFVHFDGSAETDGRFVITGGGHDAVYKTGAGDDVINLYAASVTNLVEPGSGHDRINGVSAQSETIRMGAFLDPLDKIDGISGTADTVELDGDYAAGLILGKNTIRNIDILRFAAGHDYALKLTDANLAAGKTMVVDATLLATGDTLAFDGSKELDGLFNFRGGAGRETFTGGAGDDDFHGSLGADTFRVGTGSNDLYYLAGSDSSGLKHDVVIGFDGTRDFITVGFFAGSTGVNTGTLSKATFDSGLDAAVGGILSGHGGAAFTPDAGDLAGHHYLVVNMNGVDGYQVGEDLVVEFKNAANWGTFHFFVEG